MSTLLPVLTTSSRSCYRRCQREYLFRYEQGYSSAEKARSLRFGSAFHIGIESLLIGSWDTATAVEKATATVSDPFDAAILEVMIAGYAARWKDEPLRVLAVEKEFRCALVNPDTGAQSRTFEQAGKLDAIAEDVGLAVWIVEHKTSSEDISAGSTYWEKLKMDSQVSAYHSGARALGYEPVGVLYDVAKKPQIKPMKATPPESRKYKKDGTLYASQRELDETPDEFKARIWEAYAEEPDKYFVRGEVYRLEQEEIDSARDTWHIAKSIRESQLANRWPRNPEACERYHRFCEFWPVCTGAADIDDNSRYSKEKQHMELEQVA